MVDDIQAHQNQRESAEHVRNLHTVTLYPYLKKSKHKKVGVSALPPFLGPNSRNLLG
jgi:hypothetical protein